MRWIISLLTIFVTSTPTFADEAFVTIQKVKGNQIEIVKDEGEGRGRGRRRRGNQASSKTTMVTVSSDAEITTAMRERRTAEFRIGNELAGGLRHRIFQSMQQPLSARIVSDGKRIVEINVITPEIDINQSHTDASGKTVIAVRPKRPPSKKK